MGTSARRHAVFYTYIAQACSFELARLRKRTAKERLTG